MAAVIPSPFPQPSLKIHKVKPFLKWAGGKSQLLEAFEKYFPTTLLEEGFHYYEPFLGSGAVYFHLAQKVAFQKAWLFDLNPELILTYKVVQRSTEALIERLQELEQKYKRRSPDSRKKLFYQIRDNYNNIPARRPAAGSEAGIQRASHLIFLNRTCYNGLYRTNREGRFNTPAGRYLNPKICDAENLRAAARLLKPAVLKAASFERLPQYIVKPAFVYLDPPYRPISKTANFTAYAGNVFDDEQQTALAQVCRELDRRGARFMLSNSDPKNHDPKDDFFEKLYNWSGLNMRRVPARRMINSNAGRRGQIHELVIRNYP